MANRRRTTEKAWAIVTDNKERIAEGKLSLKNQGYKVIGVSKMENNVMVTGERWIKNAI